MIKISEKFICVQNRQTTINKLWLGGKESCLPQRRLKRGLLGFPTPRPTTLGTRKGYKKVWKRQGEARKGLETPMEEGGLKLRVLEKLEMRESVDFYRKANRPSSRAIS